MAWLKCTRTRNITQVTLLYFSQPCTTNWRGRLFFFFFTVLAIKWKWKRHGNVIPQAFLPLSLSLSSSFFFFFWFVCLLVCFSLYYLNAWDRLHQLLILREVDDSYFRLDFRRLPGPVFDLPRREKAGRVTRWPCLWRNWKMDNLGVSDITERDTVLQFSYLFGSKLHQALPFPPKWLSK